MSKEKHMMALKPKPKLGCDGGKVVAKGSYSLLDDRLVTHHNGWKFLLAKQTVERDPAVAANLR